MNDHPDIAAAVNADGVHLGQDDLPPECARKILGEGKIVGVSTHSVSQAKEAQENGADYIGFGPVFRTETKDAGTPRGIDELRRVRAAVALPVLAIGGITLEKVRDVIEAGANGIAVISALLTADDLRAEAAAFVGFFGERTGGVAQWEGKERMQ